MKVSNHILGQTNIELVLVRFSKIVPECLNWTSSNHICWITYFHFYIITIVLVSAVAMWKALCLFPMAWGCEASVRQRFVICLS